MERTVCTRVAAAAIGMAAVALGGLSTGVVGHADTNVPGINSCPTGNVYVAEYEGGNPEFVGTSATSNVIELAAQDADGNPNGSNVGDTVIVCPGTYRGTAVVVPKAGGDDTTGTSPLHPSDTSKDNVTIRSFAGPGQTIVVTNGIGTGTGGTGPAAPAFTVDANGVTIGGPGFGFTIENPSTGVPSSPLIEVGTRGAQDTSNEDEMVSSASCVTSGSGVAGCDQPTPAYVPINDAVIDNVITKLVPQNATASFTLTGIELDNTINNTVQSNLITNAVPDGAHVGLVQGIAIGSTAAAAGTCANCTSGYSTNVNTALFQNAFRQVTGDHANCSNLLTAVTIDGFVLDSQVYNNLIGPLTNSSTCADVVGIESNAFGQLENEQTGTLVPVNGNIDDNTISQLGPNNSGTGIVLDPQPGPNQSTGTAPQPVCENPPTPPTSPCPSYPPSSYTITDNQIQNVATGVHVESLLGGNSYAHYTNFQNVKAGVVVDVPATGSSTAPNGAQPETNFDATNNFWGCDDGPVSSDDNNCATIAGPAFYNPWLASPVQGAGDEAGDNAGH